MVYLIYLKEDLTMVSERFPYDEYSHTALVKLINLGFPEYGYTVDNTTFSGHYFSPTMAEPGRTFIAATNLIAGVKRQFAYRRLDINKVIPEDFVLNVEGAVSTYYVMSELNRIFDMRWTPEDLVVYDHVSVPEGETRILTIPTQPECLVYYGNLTIEVTSTTLPDGVRMLEDGEGARLLENGGFRLLEQV